MVSFCKKLVNNVWFGRFVLGVILLNALLVGLETSRSFYDANASLLYALNYVVLLIFIAELVVRIVSYAPHVHRFFRDGWNVFDLLIVIASLVPAAGPLATVARVARVLRVARVVSVFPELRLIVSTMLKSIPSMGHVIALAGLLIYIYGVAGTFIFRDTDPAHWGTLGRACLTLFQVLTTEGWADIQAVVLPAHPYAWVFFTSYIVIAVFVVVNLFIAVVTNNLQSVRLDDLRESDTKNTHRELLESIEQLRERLERFEAKLRDKKPPDA
jgi:voltage-gated sodium channel